MPMVPTLKDPGMMFFGPLNNASSKCMKWEWTEFSRPSSSVPEQTKLKACMKNDPVLKQNVKKNRMDNTWIEKFYSSRYRSPYKDDIYRRLRLSKPLCLEITTSISRTKTSVSVRIISAGLIV
jgi:hypothetical protein